MLFGACSAKGFRVLQWLPVSWNRFKKWKAQKLRKRRSLSGTVPLSLMRAEPTLYVELTCDGAVKFKR